MNKGFENLNYLQEVKLTKFEKAKRTFNKVVRGTVIGLAIVGLISMAYVATHLDTVAFTVLFPNEVKSAIIIHGKGEQAKQAFIDDIYSRSIK